MLELSPADDYAHYALGRCLEKQGRTHEANGHYKLASSLRPDERTYAVADPRPRSVRSSTASRSPVTRRISSSDEMPASASRMPSWRSVVMPCSSAAAKISSVEASISAATSPATGITS